MTRKPRPFARCVDPLHAGILDAQLLGEQCVATLQLGNSCSQPGLLVEVVLGAASGQCERDVGYRNGVDDGGAHVIVPMTRESGADATSRTSHEEPLG